MLGQSSIATDTLPPSRLATGQIRSNERMRIYEIDHLAAELSVICSTNLTPGLLLTPLVVQLSNLTDSRLLKVPEKSGQKISDSDLSGPFHKYGHVRCAQFGLWQGARRAHTLQWVCNRRATPPQAKFGATRRAQFFFGQTSLLAPYRSTAGYARRSRLVWPKKPLPRTSSYLCS